MIVFGSYYVRFKKYPIADQACPNCGDGKMQLSVGCRVYHLMFVPFFPGRKQITQRCCQCGAEYEPFPEKQEAASRMHDEIKRPWYLYAGLWLIAAVGVFGMVMAAIGAIRG